jgi:osmotically-inducible protein OsmY
MNHRRTEHAGQSGNQGSRQNRHLQSGGFDDDNRSGSGQRPDRSESANSRNYADARSASGYDEREWGGGGQYDPRITGGAYGNYDAGRSNSGGAFSGSPGGHERPYQGQQYPRQQYDAPYDAYGNDYGQPSQGYARNTGSYGGNYSGVPYRADFQGGGGYQGNEPWNRNESVYGYGYQGGPGNQGGIGPNPAGSHFGQGGQYGYSSQYGSGGQYGSNYSGGHYGQGRFAQGGSFAGTQPNQQSRGFQGVGPKGYTRSDERLKEEISERLSDDPQIDASDVSIECSNGKITLSGQVDERWMKHHIENLVDRSSGVKDIDNRLTVGGRQNARNTAQNGEHAQDDNGAFSNGRSASGHSSSTNADSRKRQ